MKVALLISSYNGRHDLPLLFDSIEKLVLEDVELEVLVRDDNSSDGTAEYISGTYPSVKVVSGTTNIGFARSCNELVNISSGDVICCVNQDTILDKRFICEGVSLLKKDPEAVGVNTNMIMPWITSRDEFLNSPSENLPACEYRLTPYGYAQYARVEQFVRETNFMTGGGFFLRRSALQQGEPLFDPDIHMYCEDTELSLRIRKRGGVILYAPGSIVYHNQKMKKAGSLSELKKLFAITWNRFYVMAKHHTPWSFAGHYLLFLWGIVGKMNYLGLPLHKKAPAYIAAAGVAVPFLLLFPFWLWKSFVLSMTT